MTERNHTFTYRNTVTTSVENIFAWYEREDALTRLIPPWQKVCVVRKDPGLAVGNRIYLKGQKGPFKMEWIAEITDFVKNKQFTDIQIKGPFSYWKHQHLLHSKGANASEIEDIIDYRLPGGKVGECLYGNYVSKQLSALMTYRYETIANDMACLQRYPGRKPLRILISGATGLIGSALVPFLTAAGHTVVSLTRHERTHPSDIRWDPAKGVIEAEKLEKFDAVINLAGDNIAAGRWTPTKKARLRSSRIQSTELLVKSLATQSFPPKVFLSASATGFYGDRGDESVDEDSAKGNGFLADLCEEWEAAAHHLPDCRIASARFGIVLTPSGGALAQMLTPFKLGIGGCLGGGKQYYSWIGIDDVLYQLYAILMDERLQGPVNLVTPNPVTNYTFTKTLGKVLRRPTILPMPAMAIGLLFGEMGEALLLGSTRVMPRRLMALDLPFAYPDLEQCLRHLLGKKLT